MKTKGGKSTFYRDKIIQLRKDGKTYNEISGILGCTKSLISYHLNDKTKSDTKRRHKENTSKYKSMKRDYVYAYLETHPCVMCGESDPRVLEFDHIDPDTKRSTVAKLMNDNHGLQAIKDEIEKCRVLCANCHRRHTAEQFDTYKHSKYSEEYWCDTYNPSTEEIPESSPGLS